MTTSKEQELITESQAGHRVQVTGRHIEVTESMKSYAMEKLAKIEKCADQVMDIRVIMDIQKLDHICDLVVKTHQLKVKAHAVSQDMYASIDRAVEKLQRQLKKYRGRIHNHQARIRQVEQMRVDLLSHTYDAQNDLEEINDSIEEQNGSDDAVFLYEPHTVVRQKNKELKTLSVDEAVMKMELSQDHFLLFVNEKTQKLQVIYRRHDGNYGLITPTNT